MQAAERRAGDKAGHRAGDEVGCQGRQARTSTGRKSSVFLSSFIYPDDRFPTLPGSMDVHLEKWVRSTLGTISDYPLPDTCPSLNMAFVQP